MSLPTTLQQCLYQLSEDSRLLRAGLSTEPHSAEILAKYPELQQVETVMEAKTAYEAATDPTTKERLRRVYFMTVSFYLENLVATTQDAQDRFYAQATVDFEGDTISFYDLPIRIQQTSSPEKREQLNALRLGIVEEGTTYSRTSLEHTMNALTETLGYASYLDYCKDKKGLDYDQFKATLEHLYNELQELYTTHMGRWVETALGKSLGAIPKVHASVLINLSRFDEHIAHIPFQEKVYSIFAAMGLPFEDFPNIAVDLEERPGKNPRACCYSSVVPEEIHILLKPSKKMTDYETFLHETGHAMHYGSADPALPLEFKEFGTSYALTETYAFLFEKLMFDEGFLQEHFGFDATVAKEVSYYHTLANLWFLIRYIGKFLYEYDFFTKEKLEFTGANYASILTQTTGFLYDETSYLEDMDGEFYSADYLRAWIAERQLASYLTDHYGPRWYANPEASAFIKSLWSKGDSIGCEEMVQDILSMTPFDTAPLIASFRDTFRAYTVQ